MRTWTARTKAGAAPARVSGRFAGRQVRFDVDVHQADPRRMRLTAHGPVHMDVDYVLAPAGCGSDVTASVSIRPAPGPLGSLIARATAGLLEAGLLDAAVNRIAREASPS